MPRSRMSRAFFLAAVPAAGVAASLPAWAQSGAILAKYSKISAETMHAMTRSSYATSLNPQFIDPMLQLAAMI